MSNALKGNALKYWGVAIIVTSLLVAVGYVVSGPGPSVGPPVPIGRVESANVLLPSEGGWAGAPVLSPLTEEGVAIDNALIEEKCTACHVPDAQGRLTRISFLRKTPEGWELTLWRHKRAGRISITAEEKDEIVKYLSDNLTLAPNEVKPFAYLLERRDVQEEVENEAITSVCTRCHSYARAALQRRTEAEWRELRDLHMGQIPTIIYQMRALDWYTVTDEALDYLATNFPFETAEWTQWRATAEPVDISGTWRILGYQPGKGNYHGIAEFQATGEDKYAEKVTIRFEDGTTFRGSGEGVLYAGYSWRGELQWDGTNLTRKEILHLWDGKDQLEGRWYTAPLNYELGGDEVRYRTGTEARIFKVLPAALKAPSASVNLKILGVNLPTELTTEDINLGDGIVVNRIVDSSAEAITVNVDVEPEAASGKRDVIVGTVAGGALLTTYDKVDYIKIVPDSAVSRLGGGGSAQKVYAQFEAMGYNNGADGMEGTEDDLNLGPMDARWKLEEYVEGGEDVPFVGTIDQNGLFTPSIEGPNPRRPMSTNNVGQVWVVATYVPEDGAAPLEARAYLLVTVPRYVELPLR